MLSSHCASYVFGMWWCTSLHIPPPLHLHNYTYIIMTIPKGMTWTCHSNLKDYLSIHNYVLACVRACVRVCAHVQLRS